MKNEKKYMGFVFQKYGKFWSILLGNFIKHNPLISEECYLYFYLQSSCMILPSILFFHIFFLEISPTLTSKTHLSVPNGYSNATVKWSRTPDSPNTNIVSSQENSKIVRSYEEFSDLSSNAIELEPVSQTNIS